MHSELHRKTISNKLGSLILVFKDTIAVCKWVHQRGAFCWPVIYWKSSWARLRVRVDSIGEFHELNILISMLRMLLGCCFNKRAGWG